MASARKYITAIHEGRLLVTRGDGLPMTPDEKKWIDATLTRQMRVDKMVASSGYLEDNAVLESLQPKAKVAIHPIIEQMRGIIRRRGYSMAALSRLMGGRDNRLSEWLRGQMKPYLKDVYYVYGLMGYRLMPVPIDSLDDVLPIVNKYEQRTDEEYAEARAGSAS